MKIISKKNLIFILSFLLISSVYSETEEDILIGLSSNQQKAFRALKNELNGNKKLIKSFVQDLSKAKITYFGEKHKEMHETADAQAFFGETIIPAISHLEYDTYILESLPTFESPLFSTFYDNLYNPLAAKDIQSNLKNFISLTKADGAGQRMFDKLISYNASIYGYGVSPIEDIQQYGEVFQNQVFIMQLMSTRATNAASFFINSLESEDKYNKLALYGGAVHNDMSGDDISQGLYSGADIQAMVEESEYLAVDIIPLEWLLSDESKSNEIENNPNDIDTDRDGFSDKYEQAQIIQDIQNTYKKIMKLKYLVLINEPNEAIHKDKPTLVKVAENNENRYLAKYIIFLPR